MPMTSEPLTILTWFWKQPGGRTEYTADHVNVWADMVRRNLSMPHRIACVTAHPDGIDPSIDIIAPPGDFEDVKLPTWGEDKPQCLRRISMFRPDAASIFGSRFACMDMDTIVMGPLDPIFDRDDEFIMFAGTTAHRPYNGSLLMMNAGARRQVYDRFTPDEAIKAGFRFVGSDQAWISYVLGRGEATWGPADGIHAYHSARNGNSETRILFFFGSPKPWDLLQEDRIASFYRKTGMGRAIVLCGGETTWSDAVEETQKGKVDAVFSIESIAKLWPGHVTGVAQGPKAAAAKAFMLGYEEIALCGNSTEERCASLA